MQAIKELETQNIVDIEEKIDSIREKNDTIEQNNSVETNKANSKVNYNKKYSNSVIVGDSRAEAISAYGYLDNSSVVAYKGRNISSAKKNGDIDKAIGLYPKNIFFTYGVNDIECYSDSSIFIKEYKTVIEQVQNKLPKTKIYVSSILPVRQDAISKQPNYKNLDKFNEGLKKMCKEMDVVYLDGTSIVKESDFDADGIHFVGNFQKKWLNFFIEKANL